MWERYVHHEKLGEANPFSIRAIARAMSAHQHTVYGLEIPPHKYKDRVRRAITGEHISSETIDLLSETFGFDERTRKTLHKAATQGFDDSETVQFLRTNPQVLTSSCYLDIQLDPTDPGIFTLHATYTLLSLESGCSAFVFALPQGQELICDNRHFSVSRVSEDQEWVFTPPASSSPYKPLCCGSMSAVQSNHRQTAATSSFCPSPTAATPPLSNSPQQAAPSCELHRAGVCRALPYYHQLC